MVNDNYCYSPLIWKVDQMLSYWLSLTIVGAFYQIPVCSGTWMGLDMDNPCHLNLCEARRLSFPSRKAFSDYYCNQLQHTAFHHRVYMA